MRVRITASLILRVLTVAPCVAQAMRVVTPKASVISLGTMPPLRALGGENDTTPPAFPTLPESLARITTDTGAFALGPNSFARYTAPGLCRAAALYTARVQRLTRAAQYVLDTIQTMALARDTLPARAIEVALACGEHFTVKGTPAPELPDLFALALLANKDTLASAVVQRQLFLAPRGAARDTVRLTALHEYLTAEPARVAAAEAVVAYIDALGPSAQAMRLMAHDSLLAFASAMYDVDRMRTEAARIIALGKAVPTEAIKYDYDPIVQAYKALLTIAFVAHPDSVSAVAVRAQQDLRRFPPGTAFPPGKPVYEGETLDYKTASLDGVLRGLSPIGADLLMFGKAPPPLQATYWFPTLAHRPPGTGQVSLMVYGGHGACLGGLWGFDVASGCGGFFAGLGGTAEENQEKLAVKLSRYVARGASLTVVDETWPGAALGRLPDSAAANADTLRWYYQEHLKLPVTVAIVADVIQQFPTPDGRRFPCDVDERFVCTDQGANAQRYLNGNKPLVLLGRDGGLLYAGSFSPLFEAVLAHALAAPTLTPAPTQGRQISGGSHAVP